MRQEGTDARLALLHWLGVGATLLLFLAGFAANLVQKDPGLLLRAGVVTLILTPLAGVLFSLVQFVLRRETAMVWVCLGLSAVLVVSYLVGGV